MTRSYPRSTIFNRTENDTGVPSAVSFGHACRTPDADRGRRRPHRPDPRDLRRGAGPAGRRRRGAPRSSRATPSPCWASPGCCRCPTPRSSAAAASPTRSTCRSSRRSPSAWMSVAVGVSRALAHLLPGGAASAPTSSSATLLPGMLGGELLGAYCLSEPQAGSDVCRDHHPGHARRRRRTGSRAPRRGSRTRPAPTSTRRSCAPATHAEPRAVLLRGPGRHRRHVVRRARAQDGPGLRRRPARCIFDGAPVDADRLRRRGGRRA